MKIEKRVVAVKGWRANSTNGHNFFHQRQISKKESAGKIRFQNSPDMDMGEISGPTVDDTIK